MVQMALIYGIMDIEEGPSRQKVPISAQSAGQNRRTVRMGRAKRAVVEYRSYELPSDFPIMVLTGDKWHISHVPSGMLHIHNCLEIGLCHSESGTLVFGDSRVDFSAGDVTCIARNVPHTTYSAPGCASLWSYIFLDPMALLSEFAHASYPDPFVTQHMLSSCHMVLSSESCPELRPLINAILHEMTVRSTSYQLCVKGLCLSLMVCLLRAYHTIRQEEDTFGRYMYAIAPAIDYIHANYMHEFPQDTLAEVCHLSPTHFRRLFHEQMHTNPLTFLHQTRILESCTLLRTSEISVAEIAGRVGYTSLSSFNRNFSRIMGCTPSEWRRSSGQLQRPTVLSYSGWMQAEKVPAGIPDEEE